MVTYFELQQAQSFELPLVFRPMRVFALKLNFSPEGYLKAWKGSLVYDRVTLKSILLQWREKTEISDQLHKSSESGDTTFGEAVINHGNIDSENT